MAYSYVRGSYQKWNPSNRGKEIFEALQYLLEARTESLAQCIEQNLLPRQSMSEAERRVELLRRMDAVKYVHNDITSYN